MNKILLTIASAAVIVIGVGAISAPASAGTICSGNKNCSDNSTTNTTNNQGGTGGEGGAGGEGGDGGFAAQGQQQGIFGSGNSDNDLTNQQGQGQAQGIFGSGNSDNDLTNQQGQGQGQQQGQGQGQGQSQTGLNLQGQGQSTDNANNSSQSIYIEGDEAEDIPVSTAYSAPLTSADDTCMGSTSAGFQGMSFGISFGSTWRDEDCVRRKDSRMFYNMKMTDVAVARMCQKADNRAAVEAAGSVCPGTEASATPVAAAAELTTVEATTSRSTDWDYLDNDRGHGDN